MKMGTLKRNQSMEKKLNANLLEEARKREDNVSTDASQLKVSSRTLHNSHLRWLLSVCVSPNS